MSGIHDTHALFIFDINYAQHLSLVYVRVGLWFYVLLISKQLIFP